MDSSSGKRAPIPKKGSGLQLKNDGNMTARFCNRLGCHGRLNHTEVPTNRKTKVGSSTRTSSMETPSRKETSEASSSQICLAEVVVAESQSQSNNSNSRKIKMGESSGSSSASSSGRPHKLSRQRSGKSSQESSSGLSVSLSSKSSSSSGETIDDNTRNKDVLKKQNPSASGKKVISRPTTEGGSGSVTVPSNGISISDSRHQPRTRINRNNRTNTIAPRVPVPRPSSRSGGSSTITGREVHGAHENFGQGEGILQHLWEMEQQLFRGRMGLYDQHRDMRLDIDNMSYEDLLALEERIGNVSTGIEEEHMWKYLRKRIYQHKSSSSSSHLDHDEIQCSICQEEYMNEDEIGSLNCKHSYHLTCIHQWLKRKKWCPICKVEAVPTSLSSSLSCCD
ncbi:E3 ubiquitin-protein ligase MBR1-like [Impatiens glandulifera]|uniref:E3 ubiquitin-protein ligase MBR1-like n=1 Tax=Impatiens glandulifera TaxID=253017 RepID=UPI001FB0E796|nr:E3 ubiquitin-protein ligase MBR1-like [Impatiens glandulifera]